MSDVISLSIKCVECVFKCHHCSVHRWLVEDTSQYKGPIELFLVPASDPRLVYQRLWYVSVG